MNLDQLGLDPKWIKQKIDLLRQHYLEWLLCLTAEDESWHSLQQRHSRQRSELELGAGDGRERKQLIQQQVQDIQDWRSIMARYRQKLAAQQAEESLNLEAEKRALSRYFLV